MLARSRTGAGVQKRGGPHRAPRVDDDGDLNMDGSTGGRGRGGRARGRGGRNAPSGGRPSIANAPKGPAADRKKQSGSGIGRDASRDPIGPRQTTRRNQGGLHVPVKVQGWSGSGSTAMQCLTFLEKKTRLRFPKNEVRGDCLIIHVPVSKADEVLKWNNISYLNTRLRIVSNLGDRIADSVAAQVKPKDVGTEDTIKILQQVLAKRYNSEAKLLDLSRLGDEELLKANGFFDFGSTTSKMFPAMMLVADRLFDSAEAKREAVKSVSLAHNNLRNLAPVSSLAQTFPDITALSLEGNFIESMKGLDHWRSKLQCLKELILSENDVVKDPEYAFAMMRRYPKLELLDGVVIDRSTLPPEEKKPIRSNDGINKGLDAKGNANLPVLIKPSLITNQDVVNAFLSQFFPLFDNNRIDAIKTFYTTQSTFALQVNTSARRVEEQAKARQYWDVYLSGSRNHVRVSDARKIRDLLFRGPEQIASAWGGPKAVVPPTRHDLTRAELWLTDSVACTIANGQAALMISVHGEYDEDNHVSKSIIKRSFDRVFLVVPDAATVVKVLNDVLTVRSYAGPAHGIVQEGERDGGELTQEQQEKVGQFMEKTGLNVEFTVMCLRAADWVLFDAWEMFAKEQTAGNIPPEAFQRQVGQQQEQQQGDMTL